MTAFPAYGLADEGPITTISADRVPQQAMQDLVDGLLRYELWGRLAMHDIRQRFRRSVLGPLWLTLSMGIMVASLGLVFSTLFRQNMGLMLPFIATGLIFWGLLTSCLTDGTLVFISAESYIRNVPNPLSVHLYRMIARNLIIWMFNMVIYLAVAVWGHVPLSWNMLAFFPGMVLFVVNIFWMSLVAGILSTRYRDIPPVITNLVQVVFFVTPVFWSPDSLPNRPAFIAFNPFYHMLELVRAPLLGQSVPALSWGFTLLMAAVGTGVALLLYRRAHARIAYWV
ncbi:MAG: ABC transporter permease [Devosia sp.]|nr:ABC transporter permease [Devosia sp.]